MTVGKKGREPTLWECYQTGKRVLLAHGVEAAAFDAMQLFFKAFHINRQRLAMYGEQPAGEAARKEFEKCIDERAQGRPLQYILGEWEFYGEPFYVGEGVLIPREETQLLVEEAIGFLRGRAMPQLLELCAGSGAVSIACALRIPGLAVTAVELSPQAGEYLNRNIARHNAAVKAVCASVLEPAQAGVYPAQDAIVANPPYIPSAELSGLQTEVRREPAMAFDGGADGLLFYRAILNGWLGVLKPGGLLAVECGMGQSRQIAALFEEAGLCNVKITADFNGIDRMICAYKKV